MTIYSFTYPISNQEYMIYKSITDEYLEDFIEIINNNIQFQKKILHNIYKLKDYPIKSEIITNKKRYIGSIWETFNIKKSYKKFNVKLNPNFLKVLETTLNKYNMIPYPHSIDTHLKNLIQTITDDTTGWVYIWLMLYMINISNIENEIIGGGYKKRDIYKTLISTEFHLIYLLNIIDRDGDSKSLILKIATEESGGKYYSYKYEENVYNYLHNYKCKNILNYYGTYEGTVNNCKIRDMIKIKNIGQIKLNIRINEHLCGKHSKYIILALESVYNTHMPVYDYIKEYVNKNRDNVIKEIYLKVCNILLDMNKKYGFVHGDLHDINCLISKDGKSIIMYDFDFSLILGHLISPYIQNYEIISGLMNDIENYNKSDKIMKERISKTLYLTDIVRFYHSLRVFSMWRGNSYRNYSSLPIKIDNKGTPFNVQNMIYNTYNQLTFQEKIMYNDTNGYLVSIDYFNKIIENYK